MIHSPTIAGLWLRPEVGPGLDAIAASIQEATSSLQEGGAPTLDQVLAEQVAPLRALSGVLEVAGLRSGAVVLGLAADAVDVGAQDATAQVELVELVLWAVFHASNLLESLSHGAIDHPDQSIPVVSALLNRLGRPPMGAWELFGIPTPQLPAEATLPSGSPQFALGVEMAWTLPRVVLGCSELPGLNGFLPGFAAEVSRMTHISRAAAASDQPVPSDLASQTLADLRRILFGLAEALRAMDDAEDLAVDLPPLERWPHPLREVVQAFGLDSALPRQVERDFSSKIQAGLNTAVVLATTKAASAFMTEVADRIELGQPITADEQAIVLASLDFVGLELAPVKRLLSAGSTLDTSRRLVDLAKTLEDRALAVLALRSLPDSVEAARPHVEGVLIELGAIKSEVQLAVEAAGDLESLPSSLGPSQAQRLARIDTMLNEFGLPMMAPYASSLAAWISDLSVSPSIQLEQIRPWAQALAELEYAIEALRDGARACAKILLASRQTLALAGYDPEPGMAMEICPALVKRSVPVARDAQSILPGQEISQPEASVAPPPADLLPQADPLVSASLDENDEPTRGEVPFVEQAANESPTLELAPLDIESTEGAVPDQTVPTPTDKGVEVEAPSWSVLMPDDGYSKQPSLEEPDLVFEIDTIKEEISRSLVQDGLTGDVFDPSVAEAQNDTPSAGRTPSWEMEELPLPELDFGAEELPVPDLDLSSDPALPLHLRDLVARDLPTPQGPAPGHSPLAEPQLPTVGPLNHIPAIDDSLEVMTPQDEFVSESAPTPNQLLPVASLCPVLIVPFDSKATVSIDADMQEVFGEEIHEEIASLAEWIPDLFQVPPNPDIIYNIRKSFHTIKGSGRMVGAATLGEMAWAVEAVLNRVMEKRQPLSESVISLVLHANSMVVQFQRALSGEPACWDTRTLIDWANELQRGVDAPSPFPSSIDWSAMALELVENGQQSSTPEPQLSVELDVDEDASAVVGISAPAPMELSLAQDVDVNMDGPPHISEVPTPSLELVEPDPSAAPLSFEVEIEEDQQRELAGSRPEVDEPLAELASANLAELPLLDLDIKPTQDVSDNAPVLPWEVGVLDEGVQQESLPSEEWAHASSAPLPASSISAPTDWALSDEVPVQDTHVPPPAIHINAPDLSLIPIEEDAGAPAEEAPFPAARGFGGQAPSTHSERPVPPSGGSVPAPAKLDIEESTTPEVVASSPAIPDLPKAPTPAPERTVRPLSHDVILQGTDWKVLLANAQDQAIAARTALEAGDVNQALACIDRQVPALDRLAELVLVLERASKLASRINREATSCASVHPAASPHPNPMAEVGAASSPAVPAPTPPVPPPDRSPVNYPPAPRKEPVAVIPERKPSFLERWFWGRSKKKK